VSKSKVQSFKKNYQKFVSDATFMSESLANNAKQKVNSLSFAGESVLLPQSMLSMQRVWEQFKDSPAIITESLNSNSVTTKEYTSIKNLYLLIKEEASDCLCPFYTHVVSGFVMNSLIIKILKLMGS
jgi:hypothetical protein